MKLHWKKEPGSKIQAPISHGGSKHHYVISHRTEDHTVSFRPPGEHHHVGSYRTERDAKAAAQQHAETGVAPPSNTRSMIAAWGPKGPPPDWQWGQGKGRGHATKKKSPAQLDREIAASLTGSPTTYRSKYGHGDAEWQSGFKHAKDSARHETHGEMREIQRRLGASAHTDFDRGMLAGYAEALGDRPAHATRKKSPAAEKKRQVQELDRERERIFQAMGYAGNTAEQVRRYHDMIAEIDSKLRLLK